MRVQGLKLVERAVVLELLVPWRGTKYIAKPKIRIYRRGSCIRWCFLANNRAK